MALVPLFLRRQMGVSVRPGPVLGHPRSPLAPLAGPPAQPAIATDAEADAIGALAEEERLPALDEMLPEPQAALARPSRPLRRETLFGPQDEETSERRAALSDGLALWRACPGPACRRARACADRRGALCLREQREALAPLLDALRDAASGRPATEAPREDVGRTPKSAARRRTGSCRRAHMKSFSP